jgi:hypothetical protein
MGDTFPLREAGNLIQSVQEEEQVTPFQETLSKAFGRLQVWALKLILNKCIKTLVQAL